MEFFLLPFMPRSFLFTSFLLFSHWTKGGHAAPAPRMAMKAITVDDLRQRCSVGLDDLNYDLCPLMGRTVTTEDPDRGEGSSSGRRFYDITLGGSTGERTELGCDEDTWVCLRELSSPVPLDTDLRKMHRDPVRSIPIARKLNAISLGLEEFEGPDFRLDLDGGLWNDRPQSVVIEFLCSHQDKLAFVGENTGEHSFIWATPHACHQRLPQHTTSSRKLISVMQDEAEEPVPEDEGKKEGDDDLLPNQSRKTMRKWIAIILVVVVTSLFCGYIASSSRARHFTREKLKGASYAVLPLLIQVYVKLQPIGRSISHFASTSIVGLGTRFRQGDSQLVRWAQEDMALDDADVMVNGAGAYGGYDAEGEEWNGMDEYIPLTISPKYGKSRKVRSYGATPDVETFEERGVIGSFFRK